MGLFSDLRNLSKIAQSCPNRRQEVIERLKEHLNEHLDEQQERAVIYELYSIPLSKEYAASLLRSKWKNAEKIMIDWDKTLRTTSGSVPSVPSSVPLKQTQQNDNFNVVETARWHPDLPAEKVKVRTDPDPEIVKEVLVDVKNEAIPTTLDDVFRTLGLDVPDSARKNVESMLSFTSNADIDESDFGLPMGNFALLKRAIQTVRSFMDNELLYSRMMMFVGLACPNPEQDDERELLELIGNVLILDKLASRKSLILHEEDVEDILDNKLKVLVDCINDK
jgi:hypothetical protein